LTRSSLIIVSTYAISVKWMRSRRSEWRRLTQATLDVTLLLAVLVAALTATVAYKHNRDSMIFLLQPCHMQAAALVFSLLLSHKTAGQLAFQIILHNTWGTFVRIRS
jgi:hypothetical protein